MKYKDIREEADLRKKLQHIDECWTSHSEWRQDSLKRITGYLFTLNSGGLLASLAYLAAKENPDGIKILIWCFFAGTLLISLHAAADYYSSERHLKLFDSDLKEFYASELDWEDFLERKASRESKDIPLHFLGWASGLAFFIGLIIAICTI